MTNNNGQMITPHLSSYEIQYMGILKKIYERGYSDGVNERTGVATKRIPGAVIQVDVREEFPILRSKKVAAKTAQREIEWIWKDMSNNIHDLPAKIWDAWADKNGSIGKSYGYQIAQPVCIYTDSINRDPSTYRSYPNQREFVRNYLKEFPNGRQCTTTIWNPSQLSGMNLVPCVHTCNWNLDGGRLNLVLDQRSGDFPYGVPFNTTQYAELMCMFAYDLSVEPGILTHVIADAHIYDRQMKGVELQLAYYDILTAMCNFGESKALELANALYERKDDFPGEDIPEPEVLIQRAASICYTIAKPEFVIDSKDRDMMSYRADQCHVENYTYMGNVSFGEVVV